MPEFKLPGISFPGFRDMNSNDIKQALSEVRRPDLSAPDIDPRRIEFPRVDVAGAASSIASSVASNAASAVAAAADRNPLRRRQRSVRPMLLIGLALAIIGAIAALNAGRIKAGAAEAGKRIRQRVDAERVNGSLEPIVDKSYSAAVAIPIESDLYAGKLPSAEREQASAEPEWTPRPPFAATEDSVEPMTDRV